MRIIEALRRGHDEFVGRLLELRPADVSQASACRGWTVAEVVGHLGAGAELTLATLNGVSGEGAVERWDALSPGERVAGYPAADEALVRRFEELAGSDVVIDVGFLPPMGIDGAA